jgi:hypothetical protein
MKSGSSCAVRQTIGGGVPLAAIRAAASSPFTRGIEISSTMTSGRRSAAASTSSSPSLTAPTTENSSASSAAMRSSIG